MSDIEASDLQEPIKHQLGKLLIGTVAGFLATKLSAILYDAVLEYHANKKTAEDVTV